MAVPVAAAAAGSGVATTSSTGAILGGAGIGVAGSLLGGFINSKYSDKMFNKQADLQREFAQNSIQWRVNDAKRAGIHPLYALGAQGISYQPFYNGGSDVGDGISKASAQAGDALVQLGVQRQELENRLLLEEIRSKKLDSLARLSAGAKNESNSANFKNVPIDVISGAPKQNYVNESGFFKDGMANIDGSVDYYSQKPEWEYNAVEKGVDEIRETFNVNERVEELNKQAGYEKYGVGAFLSGASGIKLRPILKEKMNPIEKGMYWLRKKFKDIDDRNDSFLEERRKAGKGFFD